MFGNRKRDPTMLPRVPALDCTSGLLCTVTVAKVKLIPLRWNCLQTLSPV